MFTPLMVRAPVVLMLTGLAGCGCDLVGCTSGLTVRLATPLAIPFIVEVLPLPQDGSASHRVECTSAMVCGQDVMVPGVSATNVIVRITSAAGVRDTPVRNVRYTKSQPNGKRCTPTCYNASVGADAP